MKRSFEARIEKLAGRLCLDGIPCRVEHGWVFLLRDKPAGARSVLDIFERAGHGFKARERVAPEAADAGLDCDPGANLPEIGAEVEAQLGTYRPALLHITRIPRDADPEEALRRLPAKGLLFVEPFTAADGSPRYFPTLLSPLNRGPAAPERRELTYFGRQ